MASQPALSAWKGSGSLCLLSHHLLACRKRKAVVLALRGTMSMADIVTDAVAHPEQIDNWLPPHFAKVCWSSTAISVALPHRMRTSSLSVPAKA